MSNSYWNYRILRKKTDNGYEYGMYPVFYENNIPNASSSTPTNLVYYSVEDMFEDISKIYDAIKKPILDYDTYDDLSLKTEDDQEHSENIIQKEKVYCKNCKHCKRWFLDAIFFAGYEDSTCKVHKFEVVIEDAFGKRIKKMNTNCTTANSNNDCCMFEQKKSLFRKNVPIKEKQYGKRTKRM